MTTYSATGITVYNTPATDTDVEVQAGTNLELVAADDVTSLRYTVLPLEPGGSVPDDLFVDIDIDLSEVRLNGQNIGDATTEPDAEQIYQVNWLDAGNVPRTTIVLLLEFQGVNRPPFGTVDATNFFAIAGDSLPNINSLSDWNNFLNNSIQNYGVPSGSSPFGPNKDILLSSLSFSSSESDIIIGSGADDSFDGGAGNDSIEGRDGDDTLYGGNGNDTLRGGNGSDELFGGAGNDYLNPGNNSDFDYLEPGAGNDTVDFSAISNATSFAEIGMGDLSAGVTATINGNTNSGFINKGANGTTTILNLNNPMTASDGGFGLQGTDHNDVFNIVAGTTGWIALAGRGGNDTFNINSTDISGRIDSAWWDATTGVVANLDTGIISQDGHGGSDTINGWGNLNEIRTTMMNDSIIGSDGRDRIILMAGNDTADGGDGFDLLRYDRNGVDAINVNLITGTATGTWRGESFTHTISNFEEIRGSRQGDDTIIGRNDVGEYVEGRGGNDRIEGRGGDDELRGEEGNDTLLGGNGNDELRGDAGNDVLFGGAGDDELRGGDGNDSLNPGSNFKGYDQVVAGAGQDTVNFSDMTENSGSGLEHWDLDAGITAWINGNNANAWIDKGPNGSTQVINSQNLINGWGLDISGTFHDDILNITPGSDSNGFIAVVGEGGNDVFNINAGAGHVRLDFRRSDISNGVTVNLATGIVSEDGFGGQDTINGVANLGSLRTTMLNDSVIGSDGRDQIILMAGNDTVDGGAGFDALRYDRNEVEAVNVNLQSGTATGIWRGEAFTHTISNIEEVRGSRDGDDIITGQDGVGDRLEGRGGDDTLSGRGGNDTLLGEDGDDTLDGGEGNDSILTGFGNNLVLAGDGNDYVSAFGGNDEIYGGAGNDALFAGAGNDSVGGAAGNDQIGGGAGDDELWGGAGSDSVYGGTGSDTIGSGTENDEVGGGGGDDTVWAGAGDDTVFGNDGNDELSGGNGQDLIYAGQGNDTIYSGNGNDTIGGVTGDDELWMGGGNDVAYGWTGNDTLLGLAGDDDLWGGNGADVLNGGTGNDTLRGGADADVLVFSTGSDQVIGFGGGDRIDLSGVAAITGFADLQNNHLSGPVNAVINDGLGNTMTLTGVGAGTLDAGDFIF